MIVLNQYFTYFYYVYNWNKTTIYPHRMGQRFCKNRQNFLARTDADQGYMRIFASQASN